MGEREGKEGGRWRKMEGRRNDGSHGPYIFCINNHLTLLNSHIKYYCEVN